MRALIQRVSGASVTVAGEVTGAIDAGLLVLLGIARDDSPATADRMVQRLLHYRVFSDESGRMNRSLQEVGGGLLVVIGMMLPLSLQARPAGRGPRP